MTHSVEMDVMDTGSDGGDVVRDLGEEDVLSSSPPPSTPPTPALTTPMIVDQPQSPLSPITMLSSAQLDLSCLDTSNMVKRDPSPK